MRNVKVACKALGIIFVKLRTKKNVLNIIKGQEISEGNCGVFNFPKNPTIFPSNLTKWSNKKQKHFIILIRG